MFTPRTTLADIAAASGVSTATVSRVLNAKPGVATRTRNAVMSAAQELGLYLRSPGSTGLIAVIVPELGNPSFAMFGTELSIQLSAAGRQMIMCTTGPGAITEVQYLDALVAAGVTGIISVSGTLADTNVPHDPYEKLVHSGMPTVFINAYDPAIKAAYISSSDSEAIASSITHLRSFGHHKIGLAIGQERYLPTQRKITAFLGHDFPDDSVVSTTYSMEGGHAAGLRLIESGHTAIVCGSDVMALGVIRAARSLGLEVPHDVSVVGYDDSYLMAFTDPALTTVRQPVAEMCKAAVSTLLNAMEGDPIDSNEIIFHPDLIIRQSTGPVQ